jgi:hypothetical protein
MARGLATLLLVAAALAAPAHATIGSFISSFDIPASYYGMGILAQGDYVYLHGRPTLYYIYTYTHSGSLIRSRSIDPGSTGFLSGGSRTHLGPGYMAILDPNTGSFKIFSISNAGTPVASFSVTNGARNVFWDGNYYYVNQYDDRGRFLRYTANGNSAGYWNCAGWPSSMTYCYGATYAQYGNNAKGPYFVASAGATTRPYCMTTFPGGALVATWTLPNQYLSHLSYGDSSNPSLYGAAIWGVASSPYDVWEIDIDARNASAVLPASVGKIRAIYR